MYDRRVCWKDDKNSESERIDTISQEVDKALNRIWGWRINSIWTSLWEKTNMKPPSDSGFAYATRPQLYANDMVITGLFLPGVMPASILKVHVWILNAGVPTAEAVSIIPVVPPSWS